MSYPYPRVTKQLSLTPVIQGVSPRAKSHAAAGQVSNLFKFLYIPPFNALVKFKGGLGLIPATYSYSRQLLSKFNYTFTEDFYLLNVNSYRAFASYIIHGGCICIKWRVGTTVFRYKLIDSDYSKDWSYFPSYTNQLIKKNFCIEFWGTTLKAGEPGHLLAQGLTLQLSSIYEPTAVSETPAVTEISVNTILGPSDLYIMDYQNFMNMPVANVNQAFLTN